MFLTAYEQSSGIALFVTPSRSLAADDRDLLLVGYFSDRIGQGSLNRIGRDASLGHLLCCARAGSAGLCPAVAGDERAPALPGDDQPALAENLHGMPDRLVGDAVLLGQVTLGGQLVGDLTSIDAHGDGVRHLHI